MTEDKDRSEGSVLSSRGHGSYADGLWVHFEHGDVTFCSWVDNLLNLFDRLHAEVGFGRMTWLYVRNGGVFVGYILWFSFDDLWEVVCSAVLSSTGSCLPCSGVGSI